MRKIIIFVLLLFVFWETNPCWAEAIAVIVNNSNYEKKLSTAEIARIYKGKQQAWSDGSQIIVINRPATSDVREEFYKKVLNCKPTKKFYDPGSPSLFKTIVQTSDLATIRFVENINAAIGYVYISKVDTNNSNIKVLKVIE